MEKIVIEIPENIIRSVKIPPNEINERVKQELAIRLYEQGILTFGKARELAGMLKWDFHILLGKKEIIRRYDMEELERDIDILDTLD
jgi:predicted HTH domain antitoxin